MPTVNVRRDVASPPESRRLNDRICENEGSEAVASASKPKRSSPLHSATTEGNHSTMSPSWLSKLTTG